MNRPAPPELIDVLTPFGEDVREIVHRLRARVLSVMPKAHEIVWDATNAVSLVYAPSTRWQDGVCHIAVYSKYANLGFNNGAFLADPSGVLTGSGSRIRHVTLRTAEEVEAPWMDDYLRAALAHAQQTPNMGDGGTTARVSEGPKRRPQPAQ